MPILCQASSHDKLFQLKISKNLGVATETRKSPDANKRGRTIDYTGVSGDKKYVDLCGSSTTGTVHYYTHTKIKFKIKTVHALVTAYYDATSSYDYPDRHRP